ncbi:MAG: hypothetical protein AAB353_00775 [Candidatus Hydrogenedentota bacterium]
MSELNRFTETYRKFYFHDIQAISIERRPPNVLSVVAVVILILSVVIGSVFPNDAVVYVFVPALACVAIIVAIHLALGPLCTFRLHTAVQSTEIRCVGRVRTAKRLLEYILPLIYAAQTDIAAARAERTSRAAAFATERRAAAGRFDSGRLHGVYFLVLGIGCMSGLIEFWYQSVIKSVADLILALGILTLNITCLVRQRGTTLPSGVRWLTLSALFVAGVSIFGAAMIAGFYTALSGETDNPFGPNPFEPVDYRSIPYFAAYVAVISGIDGTVALAGLALLGMYWRGVSKSSVGGAVTDQ